MDGPAPTQRIVRFSPPAIGEDEIREVVDTLESEWLTTGPKTALFEQQFREFVDAPAALALNSCTAGLHLSLVALGIAAGDEVITSTLTFASTVNVIEHVGARPVLVDVEPDTLNIDPRCVERAITPRTKAIVAVHFSGHPADLDALGVIARRHGLALVEDAAHAVDAAYHGRPIGSSANLTSFSFYATKNLTTAEGGMLTGDPELVDRARILSLHGMSRNAWNRYGAEGSWFYDVVTPGFKCNMTDVQAALGLAQLARLERLQLRRAEIFARYNAAFESIAGLQTPMCRADVKHAWHLYVLRLGDGVLQGGRDALIAALQTRSICTSVHFIPVHMHTFYRDKYGYRPDDFPVALDSYLRMLSLPLSPALSDNDVTRVIESVTEVVACRTQRRAG
ncbi:MAG: DegT/DnrJ/EryC1/StrS aminotransferase family protein [Pirellulales bacterium]